MSNRRSLGAQASLKRNNHGTTTFVPCSQTHVTYRSTKRWSWRVGLNWNSVSHCAAFPIVFFATGVACGCGEGPSGKTWPDLSASLSASSRAASGSSLQERRFPCDSSTRTARHGQFSLVSLIALSNSWSKACCL